VVTRGGPRIGDADRTDEIMDLAGTPRGALAWFR